MYTIYHGFIYNIVDSAAQKSPKYIHCTAEHSGSENVSPL